MKQLVPTPTRDFRLQEMDGEVLLYHPGQTKTLYLNQSASLIWQLCDGQRNVGEIESLLAESFPESESIEADITDTLNNFAEHGAVKLA